MIDIKVKVNSSKFSRFIFIFYKNTNFYPYVYINRLNLKQILNISLNKGITILLT